MVDHACIACLGLLLGLDSTAVGSLITFGTAAIYVAFLLIALGRADRPRARHLGARRPRAARPRRAWSMNVARGRLAARSRRSTSPGRATSLAPPGAPFYQVWAAPLVLALIAVVGLAYLLIAKPERKL